MEKVVVIRDFTTPMEAEVYRALLEAEGVHAELQNDLAMQVLAAYGGQMPVRLLVAEVDADRAREILAARFDTEEFDKEAGVAKE